jgi:hypothetical protein
MDECEMKEGDASGRQTFNDLPPRCLFEEFPLSCNRFCQRPFFDCYTIVDVMASVLGEDYEVELIVS